MSVSSLSGHNEGKQAGHSKESQPKAETGPDKLRVLILTSSTGGGHDSRSYSLASWLEASGECETKVEHLLENSSWLPRFGVWVYNTIQKIYPGLHNIYWFIAEIFARMQGQKLSFGRSYYTSLIESYRPNLVISMHDCLNRGYFQEAVKLLPGKVRTCTYCGEWSGGFGFSMNWLEPSADLFISRTGATQLFAVAHGMPPASCEVFRNILPPRAFEERLDYETRADFRQSIHLERSCFTVLLASGAAGANNHVRLLRHLHKIPGTQAIVICGKSQKAMNAVMKWKKAHPDYGLHVEGYSKQMHLLLQASDCVVSRGGSNTTAEALFHRCPILFNRMDGVMPQERLTLNYFIGQGAALGFGTAGQFARIIRALSSNPYSLGTIRRKLDMLHTEEHPKTLVTRLIKLAKETTSTANGEPDAD